MKILFIKAERYNDFLLLENETRINGIDVLIIDGIRNIHDISLIERDDSEHFITYNREDYHLGTRGISARTNYDDYLLLEKKVLDRIEENETIILVAEDARWQDEVCFMIYLMQKKRFILHVMQEVWPKYESNDYHELLRTFENLDSINSICYLNGNKYSSDSDESIEVWRENEKLQQTFFLEKVIEAVSHIDNLDNSKFYVYNHHKNQYIETQRPKYSGNSMFEFVTPSQNEDICELLYSYRKSFADKYNIEYDIKSCSECESNCICKSVCQECDWKSKRIWNKKYIDPYEDFDTGEESYPYEYNRQIVAKINGIDRMRIDTDGNGIHSLILMADCCLDCKYCGNEKYKEIFPETESFSVDKLGDFLEKDGVYFEMTDGGVTFGGGEPLLQADFIHEFHNKYPMWNIVIETCLNVDYSEIEKIAADVGYWYIDIKDMNSEIYERYTGKTNEKVLFNLRKLLSVVPENRICIRIPRIPDFNTESDIEHSLIEIKKLGYNNMEVFEYKKL